MDDKDFRKELVEKYLPEFFIIKEFLEAENPIHVIDSYLDSEYYEDEDENDTRYVLAIMIEEYCRKKGWLVNYRFIWRNNITIDSEDDVINTLNKLRRMRDDLERVRDKGIAEILEIRTGKGFSWNENQVIVDTELARKYLGRDLKEGERITVDEAIEIIRKAKEDVKKWYKENSVFS